MSGKNSRHTPSPSPASPPVSQTPSKLPRFLQKQGRDRSKSVTDPGPAASPSTSSIASSSTSPSPEPYHQSFTLSKPRKTSKFLSINRDKDREEKARKAAEISASTDNYSATNNGNTSVDMDEPPVIVEPVNIPRPRTRSERPANSAPEPNHIQTLYSSTSSTSRIGDLPTRLSGWFTHTFSTSSSDLSLPNLIQQNSPKGKGPSALLTAAKNGKGHLDKAMRYLLDSDATPDRCTDPIWLLGVQHPGYEPPLPLLPNVVQTNSGGGRHGSVSPNSFRSSTSSMASNADLSLSQSQGPSSSKHANPAANWPPVFYIDFTSRIWLTYRSQFSTPIKDTRLADLAGDNWEAVVNSPTTVKTRPWNWGAEKTWTSDTGWGCMLRTGQSLLANALVHMHLGRDWRRPPYPVQTADYAMYVQILTWFFDTPAPEAPFSVHRMALAGKELGTDVGQWFGPSVAAGAIRSLVQSYQECGLAVSVATDSTLYQSQVFAASHGDTSSRSPRRKHTTTWGDRPVLLLLGIRLGIEGVNPIYYETIKLLYTFPQSVGIAGGRPSSSYYFVGSQADNLFYLDPHNTRPAIPLRPPLTVNFEGRGRNPSPPSDGGGGRRRPGVPSGQPRTSTSSSRQQQQQHQQQHQQQQYQHHNQYHQRVPTSPSSVKTGSSNFSYHAPVSPSPLQQQFSSSSADSGSSGYVTREYEHEHEHNTHEHQHERNTHEHEHEHSRSPPPSYPGQHGRLRSASGSAGQVGLGGGAGRRGSSSEMDHRELMMGGNGGMGMGMGVGGGGDGNTSASGGLSGGNNNHHHHRGLDPLQLHYCTAYSAAELKTFHCERVRKMPMSGLDPSMLIGFLCRDEEDWRDFRRRVGELPRTIFSVQEEPPTWPSDSDDNMGLESISEPDDMDLDDDDEEVGSEEGEEIEVEVEVEDGGGEQFFDTHSGSAHSGSAHSGSARSGSASTSSASAASNRDGGGERRSEEVDTEEDSVDPLTPGPTSRFDIIDPPSRRKRNESEKEKEKKEDGDEDDDDDRRELDFRADDDDVEGFGVVDDDDGGHDDDDIEDDWVDPSVPTPTPTRGPPPVPVKDKDPSPSPPSSSNVPPLAKSKSVGGSSSKYVGGGGAASGGKSKKTKKQIPVPVPAVRLPLSSQQRQQQHHQYQQQHQRQQQQYQQQQEHYPFPVTPVDDPSLAPGDRVRSSSTKGKRMHTARARDGGRTQSGGVKGILTDD